MLVGSSGKESSSSIMSGSPCNKREVNGSGEYMNF